MRGLSKRAVLRAGYGAVMGLLVLSGVEAYRIQAGVSQQHLDIYRSYVDEENTLAILRRSLWLAGTDVRDFFIRSTPEQAATFGAQLADLRKEDDQALDRLARISTGVAPKLRQSLNEFWAVLEPLPGSMLHQTDARRFDFLQREIVPRRGDLYNAVLDLSSAAQQRLEAREREFSNARRRAAGRLVLMLACGLLLGLAVARFSLRHAEHLEREAERHVVAVEQARGELQQLSARLLEIEEEGRRNLSRELHDEIGQTLALLQIEVSHAQRALLDPAAARVHLERAREMAERAVATIRNISGMLRPALLDDLGLAPALQFQLEDFLRRSGIGCEFAERDVSEHLPDGVKTCVYRVVQEALHNAEKHSAATQVRVSVKQTEGWLVAEIADNGRGFVWNGPGRAAGEPRGRRGFGLMGIRERAAIAGGTLQIDSAPGRGARIVLRIPVPRGTPAPVESPREVIA